MAKKQVGTCKWWSSEKGYGFLTPDDGGKDLFVHYTAIHSSNKRRDLQEGDRVEFVVIQGQKGPAADEVTVIA